MLYGFGNQMVILLTSNSMTLKSRERPSLLELRMFSGLFNTISLSIPYVEDSFLISHFSSFFLNILSTLKVVYCLNSILIMERNQQDGILIKLPPGCYFSVWYFSVGYLLCPGVGRVGSRPRYKARDPQTPHCWNSYTPAEWCGVLNRLR